MAPSMPSVPDELDPAGVAWSWTLPTDPDVAILVEGYVPPGVSCVITVTIDGRSRGISSVEAVKMIVSDGGSTTGTDNQVWAGLTAAGFSIRDHFPSGPIIRPLSGKNSLAAVGPANLTIFVAVLNHERPADPATTLTMDCTKAVALSARLGIPVAFDSQSMQEGTGASVVLFPGLVPEAHLDASVAFEAAKDGFLFLSAPQGETFDERTVRVNTPNHDGVLERGEPRLYWSADGPGPYGVTIDGMNVDGMPIFGVFLDATQAIPVDWHGPTDRDPQP